VLRERRDGCPGEGSQIPTKSLNARGTGAARFVHQARGMNFRSMVFVGFVGVLPLAGCALASGSDTATESPAGTVEMKLQTTSPSGATYRLRNAVFTIVDEAGTPVATLDSEDAPPDAAALSASLGIGSYGISLASGWFVERNGQVVDALLTSAASRPFNVFVDSATVVSYAFKVEGEPIVIGGTLNVSIDVGECSDDPWEPNDTRETAAALQTATTRGSVCGEDDWFTFSVGAPGTPLALTLDFVHENGDLDVQLFQPDMTVLASEGITSQERIAFTSQEGAYFARVYGFNGAVGDYALSIGAP
jgi:pre-peptidase